MSTTDGYYRQVDGLAMGSQPAPLLANIWLSTFEPTISDDAKLFHRYMDDILRTIKRHKIQSKLAEINSLHQNLKFTVDTGNDGSLPFLDMSVLHHENKLSSTWYVKPSDT